MAHRVLTNGFVKVAGVDLSSHAREIGLTYEAEAVDDTSMGDDTEINLGGVKRWQIDVQFAADEAASAVAQTLFSQVGNTATVRIQANATTAVSGTNPQYRATGLVQAFNPLEGSHGDLAMSPCVIRSAGTLSRSTST